MSRIVIHIERELEDLIPEFLANRRKDVGTIRSCLEAHDLDTIARLGHSMKGCGVSFGFDFISEVGVRLEKAAPTSDRDAIRESVDELETYLDEIDVVYDD